MISFLMISIALFSDAGRCLDTPFQGGYRSDIFRADPFFAIFFSTPRLLAQTHLTRPVEIDDTYKLIYEGYSVTLMGQTDSDRVFHVRGVGISTNSTEEVGEIYFTAWKQHVQGFSPSAYLGDAAEAYANSARAVFPDLATRLMCYAHVYKVGEPKHVCMLRKSVMMGFRKRSSKCEFFSFFCFVLIFHVH